MTRYRVVLLLLPLLYPNPIASISSSFPLDIVHQGENPEAFFLPYLWQLVVARTPDLNWNPRKIRIFNPPAVATSELAAAAPVEAVKAVGSAILNENIDPSRGSSIGAGDERSVDVGGNGEVLGAGHESTKEDEVQDMIAGDLRV